MYRETEHVTLHIDRILFVEILAFETITVNDLDLVFGQTLFALN